MFLRLVYHGNVLETPPFITYCVILSHQVAKKIFPYECFLFSFDQGTILDGWNKYLRSNFDPLMLLHAIPTLHLNYNISFSVWPLWQFTNVSIVFGQPRRSSVACSGGLCSRFGFFKRSTHITKSCINNHKGGLVQKRGKT